MLKVAVFLSATGGGILLPEYSVAELPPNALWHVVDKMCVPAKQSGTSTLPCLEVDLERGFAVISVAPAHLLIVPTRRLQGIESPELLASDSANYWEYAWSARGKLRTEEAREIRRDDVAMAINSTAARSQDQLHIHLGCIRPDVRAALEIYESDIGTTWSKLPFAIGGGRYRVMRVNGGDLGEADPFKLLAGGIQAANDNMGAWAISIAGAQFRDGRAGFNILASESTPASGVSGEALLDYECKAVLGGR